MLQHGVCSTPSGMHAVVAEEKRHTLHRGVFQHVSITQEVDCFAVWSRLSRVQTVKCLLCFVCEVRVWMCGTTRRGAYRHIMHRMAFIFYDI